MLDCIDLFNVLKSSALGGVSSCKLKYWSFVCRLEDPIYGKHLQYYLLHLNVQLIVQNGTRLFEAAIHHFLVDHGTLLTHDLELIGQVPVDVDNFGTKVCQLETVFEPFENGWRKPLEQYVEV